MKKHEIKVAILRIEGTNCEQESFDAFQRLGTQPEFVHLKQLLHLDCTESEKRDISEYQCVMIPGGFSAGDYIRAGAIFAALIKSKLKSAFETFIQSGYPVLGICNGFQVLIELGFLPDMKITKSDGPQACLHINDSGRYECRPTLLKHENAGTCAFTTTIPRGDVRMIPSAHAEGKLIFAGDDHKKIIKDMEDNDQIVFRYVDLDGNYGGYPWNPNGSLHNIAGICNRTGNVFGMMPHPERVFYRHQHPDWTRTGLGDGTGDGRAIFESVISYIEKTF